MLMGRQCRRKRIEVSWVAVISLYTSHGSSFGKVPYGENSGTLGLSAHNVNVRGKPHSLLILIAPLRGTPGRSRSRVPHRPTTWKTCHKIMKITTMLKCVLVPLSLCGPSTHGKIYTASPLGKECGRISLSLLIRKEEQRWLLWRKKESRNTCANFAVFLLGQGKGTPFWRCFCECSHGERIIRKVTF